MKTKVGLWIDHGKAIIVTVTDQGEKMNRLLEAATQIALSFRNYTERLK